MWAGPFEQTFVPPSHGGAEWNLASIGPVVSEENTFENVDIHTHTRTTEASLFYSSPIKVDRTFGLIRNPLAK